MVGRISKSMEYYDSFSFDYFNLHETVDSLITLDIVLLPPPSRIPRFRCITTSKSHCDYYHMKQVFGYGSPKIITQQQPHRKRAIYKAKRTPKHKLLVGETDTLQVTKLGKKKQPSKMERLLPHNGRIASRKTTKREACLRHVVAVHTSVFWCTILQGKRDYVTLCGLQAPCVIGDSM